MIYSFDGKAYFSASSTPNFSVTWSFRNYSNIYLIFCTQIRQTHLNLYLYVPQSQAYLKDGRSEMTKMVFLLNLI